jgi:molybdopterin-guanine dinucleotide biosynthesis protein A
MVPSFNVTGLILCGGRGSRMGGVDKGLQLFRGRTLVDWVLERLEPQVDQLLISANQNLERYLERGHPVLRDRITGFAGPLAGLHAALREHYSEVVVMVPCDSPFLPRDLVVRLSEALLRADADVAFATAKGQTYPVVCACRVSLEQRLGAYLEAGGRKVDSWYATLNSVEVAFDEQASAFRNINTIEELVALQDDWRVV